MRIVFWQNCLSPHQLPYIVHLLDDERVDSVVICVGETVSKDRSDMGWDLSEYEGLDKCELYINPMPLTVDYLLSVRENESYHLFSGIRGFKFVFESFIKSLLHPIKRGVITERPFTYYKGKADGKPLWMHKIRFMLQDRKFINSVDSVFAMGEDAAQYFKSVFTHSCVYPFVYCTKGIEGCDKNINESKLYYAFVGSLSPRKAPMDILKALSISNDVLQMGGGNCR